MKKKGAETVTNQDLEAINAELRLAVEQLQAGKEELQTLNRELKVKIEETVVLNADLQNLITERNRAEHRQAFLLRTSNALRPLNDPNEIRSIAMQLMGEYLNVNRSVYVDAENDPDTMRVISDFTRDVKPWVGMISLSDFGAALGEDFAKGKTVVIDDVNTDERFINSRAAYALLEISAAVGVPLFKNGHVVASMGVHNKTPRCWAAHEIAIIEETAELTWGAVERAKAEEALRISEQRLRLMVNMPRIGVITFDYAGNMLSANDAFLEMTGYGRNELEKQKLNWRHFTPAEHIENSVLAMEQLKTTGRGGPYEKEYFRKDGTRLWMMFVAADLGDGTLVEYVIDITPRKVAERQLKELNERLEQQVGERTAELTTSHDLLQATLDSSLNMIQVFKAVRDESGRIVDFTWVLNNATSEKIYGEVLGESLLTLNPGVKQTGIFDHFVEVTESGRPQDYEQHYVYEQFDGWYYQSAVKLNDGVATSTQDITTRKTAEFALKQSLNRLQTIFDTTLIGISLFAPVRDEKGVITDFRIMMVNKKVEKSAGREDMVGQLYSKLFPGIKELGLFDLMVKVIRTGEPAKMEYRYNYEGFDKWYSTMFVKGEDILVGTNLDITDRKQSEEKRLRDFVLLQQSEELAGIGSWDYDLLTGNFMWSDGMYRLFDVEKGVEIRPDIYRRYATVDCRDTAAWIVSHIEQGDAEFEETLTVIVSETIKVLRLKATIIKNNEGKPVRVLGVDMDVTATRAGEEKLRQLEIEQQLEIFRVTLTTQEEERRRISESLHNGLGQLLYGIKISMSELTPALALSAGTGYDRAKQYTEELLTEAIKESRRISHELMPMVLTEFGLAEAIKDICRQLQNGIKFKCRVLLQHVKLDKYLELAIYRTVQELMLNVVKHAAATEGDVDITVVDDKIMIRVKDNGKGLATPHTESGGIGLASVRSKASLLNGSVTLTSSPGEGTVVEVWFMLGTAVRY